MSSQDEQTSIRILEGRRISTLGEVAKFDKGLLLGSCSNGEAHAYDSALYSPGDVFTKQRLFVSEDGLANINILIGPMGSGKTTVFNRFIDLAPEIRAIINDPKGEFVMWAYDEAHDIIVGFPDSRASIWDIIAEVKADPQVSDKLFFNMLSAVSGDDKESEKWNKYGATMIGKLVSQIIASGVPREDYPTAILAGWKMIKQSLGGDEMQLSGYGTATPGVAMLFQMYSIGIDDNRNWFVVEDLLKYRRTFMLNNTKFTEVLKMQNNALLAMIVCQLLSRPEVKRGDIEKYISIFLDEYLTFKLDKETKALLMTLCRAKGIPLYLGLQYLPQDKEEISQITASRYLTCVFRTGDAHTAEEVEKLTGQLKYQRKEDKITQNSGGGNMLSLMPQFSLNEDWITIDTHQVPKGLLRQLPPYVCMVEINDKERGQILTYCKPAFRQVKNKHEGFIYSDVARNALKLEEVL